MEIRALQMVVTEQDLNSVIQKHLPPNQSIEDLRLSITPQGLVVSGVYPLFIQVQFETRWEIGVRDGLVIAQLAQFKAMGIPGNIFKSAIVKIIEELAKKEPWITRAGDTLVIDVDAAMAQHVFAAQTHLRQIECEPGQIVIIAQRAVDAEPR